MFKQATHMIGDIMEGLKKGLRFFVTALVYWVIEMLHLSYKSSNFSGDRSSKN